MDVQSILDALAKLATAFESEENFRPIDFSVHNGEIHVEEGLETIDMVNDGSKTINVIAAPTGVRDTYGDEIYVTQDRKAFVWHHREITRHVDTDYAWLRSPSIPHIKSVED